MPVEQASTESTTMSSETAECCQAAERPVSDDEIAADVELLTAAANETRYEILRRIDGADAEVCVCRLETALPVSQGAISQALSRLTDAGLVTRRKEGRWRYYATTDAAEQLLGLLDQTRHHNNE